MMEILMETLFETEWGVIILGIFLLIALTINFWNKPKT